MSTYDILLKQERDYLKSVISFLEKQIEMSIGHVATQKKDLVALRKEMFEEGIPAADDYERQIELAQYQAMEQIESSKYTYKLEKLDKYKKIIDKPYFGRFDFKEDGEGTEPIYVGYHNVMNDDTYEVMVYDWRAPIASAFYRSEIGRTSYKAPCGEIEGEILLKRQYEISKQKLEYFFDCSIAITDEILQQALGKNASSQMKGIVETIQKEQDVAIRDKENDLLIVQGVAGSGKTSIAMHRIAFLLYDRINEGLTHNNIMIISPNSLFGEYISDVLPELGEENVSHVTIEDIFDRYFKGSLHLRSRNSQLEYMITSKYREQIRKTLSFKGSSTFITILDRLVNRFEHQLLKFEDIYYAGQLVISKEDLKKQFLDNTINMSIGKRLDRLERIILKKIRPFEKEKQKEIEKEIEKQGDYEFEENEEAKNRLRVYKQEVYDTLRRFIKVDSLQLYRRLFKDRNLFKSLTKGLTLPKEIDNIVFHSTKSLKSNIMPYEDGIALLYLKLKIEGENLYPQIKQVLVDEAQDYYPLHYKVLAEVFKGAQYTILGDVCQTIEKQETESLYDEITRLLQPKKALKLKLTKSYRSSYEISQFNQKLRGDSSTFMAFERHDETPLIVQKENSNELFKWMLDIANGYKEQGFETTAIICKSKKQVLEVYEALKNQLDVHILKEDAVVLQKGVLIMPVYMAKGLEYDTVIVYEPNKQNYYDASDKQLLYIAGTRALHRLALGYTGEISPYLR